MKMMTITKLGMLTSLLSVAATCFANTVIINNKADQPLSLKYQLAYHNPGQAVVLKKESERVIPSHTQARISFELNGYQCAGVVVVAAKSGHRGRWHVLPESVRQFDQSPGCWMSTDHQRRSGQIDFSKTNCSITTRS